MQQIIRRIFFIILLLSLGSCGSGGLNQQQKVADWMQPNGKLKVLCTTAIVADMVRQIGGDSIDVLELISGQLDPHSYQMVKGDDEKIRRADVIFYSGLGLEHGPALHEYLHHTENAFSVADTIAEQFPEQIIYLENVPDPHIWMDLSLWVSAVDPVRDVLIDMRPEERQAFSERAEQVSQAYQELDVSIRNQFDQLPEQARYLVTGHDAFNYYARAYLAPDGEQEWMKRCIAPEGLAPDSQLSTEDIREVIDHMSLYNIRVLFPEVNLSQASIQKVVDAGASRGLQLSIAQDPIFGDTLAAQGEPGDTYLSMMKYNADTIIENLEEG